MDLLFSRKTKKKGVKMDVCVCVSERERESHWWSWMG